VAAPDGEKANTGDDPLPSVTGASQRTEAAHASPVDVSPPAISSATTINPMASRRTGRGNFTLTETIQRPPSFDYAASRDTPKTIKAVATRPQNQDFRNVAPAGATATLLPSNSFQAEGEVGLVAVGAGRMARRFV
jgi:hypothetical protein